MTVRPTSLFYAYPANPQHVAETINGVCNELSAGGLTTARTWQNLSVTGTWIIDEILATIDASDIFCCDLTSLNSNVLFELGFALARRKRVWLSMNTTIETAKRDFDRMDQLVPVGYASYTNRVTLVEAFYREQPWNDLTSTLSDRQVTFKEDRDSSHSCLYLKSAIETDASIALSQELGRWQFHPILDDPAESPTQSLSWYIANVRRSDATVAHLLSEHHVGAARHNAKVALVSGLARGFGKPILMLAHEPYHSPFDYRELLRTHATASECGKIAQRWCSDLSESLQEHEHQVLQHLRTRERNFELRALSVGEILAENEQDGLADYFVETREYLDIVNGRQVVFVGRKGTGKTANMYAAARAIEGDRRNHVCIVTPVAYELEGVLRMLRQSIDRSERGFLIESLWKFLIYTELANGILIQLDQRPKHYEPTDAETELLTFASKYDHLVRESFSIRLQNAVERLCHIEQYRVGDEQRARVSEILHTRILGELRRVLGSVLSGKEKVAILVDNLDKAWGARDDIVDLSDLLFGLLGVSGRILEDFNSGNQLRKKIDLSLTIFLRTDIYSSILRLAKERDKIIPRMIRWTDPELLLRLVDERLEFSLDDSMVPSEIWKRYFEGHVGDLEVRQFIVESTLPRPRDILFLMQTALEEAVNRGHDRVRGADFVSARKRYSQWALDSLVAEDRPDLGQLEAVLYEFAGVRPIMPRSEVVGLISGAGVQEQAQEEYLDLLCDLNFLQIESGDGSFALANDERHRRVMQLAARRRAAERGSQEELYQVNPPFHAGLEIV